MPTRRDVHRYLVAHALATSATGCASRHSQAPSKPLNLRRLAMLEVLEHPAEGDAVPFQDFVGSRFSVPPPVSAALLGMALAGLMRNAREADRHRLANAVARIGFDARSALQGGVLRALGGDRLDTSLGTDLGAAVAVRSGRSAPLPANADAWLDVVLTGAGYFPAKQVGGFSPMLYFTVQLRSASASATGALRAYDYASDYRPTEHDPRFFTAPRSLSVSSLDEFADRAAELRAGLQLLLDRMCDRVALDLADDLTR